MRIFVPINRGVGSPQVRSVQIIRVKIALRKKFGFNRVLINWGELYDSVFSLITFCLLEMMKSCRRQTEAYIILHEHKKHSVVGGTAPGMLGGVVHVLCSAWHMYCAQWLEIR